MKGNVIANKYRISNQLGVGGMGTVYQAEHLVLERESAIKILHAQLSSDGTFVERFMREARAMARLDHDNIIRIYDVFKEDNMHYIAMELFNGISLKSVIERGSRLPLHQVISITSQCARGLAYAHAQGIVHRDIKPSNIMINADGLIKITDFGIAAAMDDSVTLTTTGQLVGTPRYMSPEQAKNEPVDRRSDIYALGMVCYELLTGTTPFDGDSGVAIIGKLAYETGELLLDFSENVPEALQHVVKKMLARSADDRFSHATHLMQALKAVSESIPAEEDATEVLSLDKTLVKELELEPKYSEQHFADPVKTTIIKNPPSKLANDGKAKDVKKTPWIKTKTGAFAAVLSIFIGVAIGAVLVISNPEFNIFSGQSSEEQQALASVNRVFDELLQLQTSMQKQKALAQEWGGDRLAAEKFNRAIDKELIATQSIPAIKKHIKHKDYQSAQRSIKTATLLLTGARDLYLQSVLSAKKEKREQFFQDIEDAKSKTLAMSEELSRQTISEANKSSYQSAEKATTEANAAYDQLQSNWNTLNVKDASKEKQQTLDLYQAAFSLYSGLNSFVQQEEMLNTIYSIRARVRELRGEIKSAKEIAQIKKAEKLAKGTYNKARKLNGQLGSLLVEADQTLKQKDYPNTKLKLEKSIQLAEKTLVVFQNAGKRADAENTKILVQLRKAEQQRLADEARRKQKARELQIAQLRAKQEAEKQRNQHAMLKDKPSQRDVVAVEKMLNNFKQAIEEKNLAALQQVADLSDGHMQIMREVFKRFNEVHLSVTSYSLSRSGATARFKFEKLVTANGDDVLPSSKWRNGKLVLEYSSKGWKKIRWE